MRSRRVATYCAGGVLLAPALGLFVAEPETSPPSAQAAPASVTTAGEPQPAPVVVDRVASATVDGGSVAPPAVGTPAAVSATVLDAYRLALAVAPESCHLPLSLLMAIGQVESGNLAGRRLDAHHRATPPVIGPVLDGSHGFAAVADSDRGQLDGDKNWDRAVGPMQFIPSSWRIAAVDMDGDGVRDPQDIEDAAGAAMVYLCAGGRDLATGAGLQDAILAYNHSTSYLRLVLAWKKAYDASGTLAVAAPLTGLDAVEVQPWHGTDVTAHARPVVAKPKPPKAHPAAAAPVTQITPKPPDPPATQPAGSSPSGTTTPPTNPGDGTWVPCTPPAGPDQTGTPTTGTDPTTPSSTDPSTDPPTTNPPADPPADACDLCPSPNDGPTGSPTPPAPTDPVDTCPADPTPPTTAPPPTTPPPTTPPPTTPPTTTPPTTPSP